MTRLQQVSKQRDFGGVDFEYRVNESCPLAVRVRYNRPPGAHNIDVTFRSTEPAKMRAHTYAPLMIFIWIVKGEFIYGRLLDVYTMAEKLDPPMQGRELICNPDGTAFFPVGIPELRAIDAQLRHGDKHGWVTEAFQGERRLQRILRASQAPAPTPEPAPSFLDDDDDLEQQWDDAGRP